MPETNDVLQQLVSMAQNSAHSAGTLTLYALASTMQYEQAGCLFKLNKLRDLSEEERKFAYQLMELMAQNGNQGDDWDAAMAQLDNLIRNG
ncbi:hypothetical protein [Solemya velum gill symbiont]|uniref:hypothetical protein n=1 Tax=Solemya velum gill symbiont TaxID=2340 RepID=UPI000996F04B|nr:hypothetical protein [Solemya velum gill symbiont]OOY98719.1 hypothetical protein BOW19_07350 [Solemya velum gill symbiont]OOZ01010.1 hypothetical protein BOW20_07010 [Solemya velum gill symbiont]OOZ03201.1 hypothetical protein BOW21_07380 [Solemya velum gill symbiont]OOZ05456.1 hypothetical protein BOW22_07340 [Solemya velum gill symbiont]OOZ07693.1 hypothetical protein BOW23_07340 [Solemya velum gill symbiont]